MRSVRTLLCAALYASLLALSLTALLPASRVHASTPQERAHARELYTKGQRLFREGDYREAERAFEEAYQTVPNAVVLLSIAECQVRNEEYAKAIDSLETYLREKPDARDRAEVSSQIEALRSKPATLAVSSNVLGAEIFVDDSDTGAVTPTQLTLSAGEHLVALSYEGYLRSEQAVQLDPGGSQSLRVVLELEPPPPVAEPEPQPVEAEPEQARHAGPAIWVLTGVGAAGLVTGITLGALALKKEKEFNDHPTNKTADQGERMALFSDIGFGIAGAAAVSAIVVYFTSGKRKNDESAQNWSLSPTLSPRSGGVAASARF